MSERVIKIDIVLKNKYLVNTTLQEIAKAEARTRNFHALDIELEGVFATPPAPWSPLDLSPECWFDAQDFSTIHLADATHVEQWDDKSGNDTHAIVNALIRQPTWDGISPAIDFSAQIGNHLKVYRPSGNILIAIEDWEVWMLTESGIVNKQWFNSGGANSIGGGNDNMIITHSRNFSSFGALSNEYFNTALQLSGKRLMNTIIKGSTNEFWYYEDDRAKSVVGTNSNPNWETLGLVLGSHWSNSVSFQGIYYEFLFFERILGDAERTLLKEYLQVKWGL